MARELAFQVLAMEPPSRGWWGEKGSYQAFYVIGKLQRGTNWPCHFIWDGGEGIITVLPCEVDSQVVEGVLGGHDLSSPGMTSPATLSLLETG